MKPKIVIQNVVATASLDTKLDLGAISERVGESTYNPNTFPGLVLRTAKPKAGTLLFSSGKMVCLGTKSPDQAGQAVKVVVDRLLGVGIKIKDVPSINVENVVGMIVLGRSVRLEDAALSLPRSMYEPDMFPGLVYRPVDPKVALLVFTSGKVVCAGAKKVEDVTRAAGHLAWLLESKDLFGAATS